MGGHGPGQGGSASHRRSLLLLVASLATLVIAGITTWQVKAIDLPFVGEHQDSPGKADQGQLCTLIGCAPPGVYVLSRDVRDAYPNAERLEACADRYCATSELGRSNLQSVRVRVPYTKPEPVAVSVSVLGANSRPLARVGFRGELERSYPNGRECDEGCLGLTVLYEATKAHITANPKLLRAAGLDPE